MPTAFKDPICVAKINIQTSALNGVGLLPRVGNNTRCGAYKLYWSVLRPLLMVYDLQELLFQLQKFMPLLIQLGVGDNPRCGNDILY